MNTKKKTFEEMVHPALLSKYDEAKTDKERARISLTFFRNHIKDRQDALLTEAMEECGEFCTAKTNSEAVKAVQEDTLSYLTRCHPKTGKAILPSLQVVKADTRRLKKMLCGGK